MSDPREAAVRGTVPARDVLHRAVLAYADERERRLDVDFNRLDMLFEAIIDAAEAVVKSDQAIAPPVGQGEEGER